MVGVELVATVPWADDLVVVGELNRAAHLVSLSRERVIAVVDTVFDFGGQRLCLVPGTPPVLVAGAWERHGVCG